MLRRSLLFLLAVRRIEAKRNQPKRRSIAALKKSYTQGRNRNNTKRRIIAALQQSQTSALRRRRQLLGALGERQLLLHGPLRVVVVQFRRQVRVARPRRDRHLQRLALGQVLHRLD